MQSRAPTGRQSHELQTINGPVDRAKQAVFHVFICLYVFSVIPTLRRSFHFFLLYPNSSRYFVKLLWAVSVHVFSSPLQAVQTIVFSNYFRCIARLEPLQFKPLFFPTIFDVSSHVSVLATSARSEPTAVQTIAFLKLFPFFSKQFTSLHFQRFYIAFSTILYFFCPSHY